MAADLRSSIPLVYIENVSLDNKPNFRLCDEYIMGFDERKTKILELLRETYPNVVPHVGLPRVRRCNNSLEYPVDVECSSRDGEGKHRRTVVVPEEPKQVDIDNGTLE